jgi:hypothetical protein
MAGTVTVTESVHTPIKKIRRAWTATAGGAADLITSNAYYGNIQALVTIPDAGVAPTTLYDITITDTETVDVLSAVGANRSATATESVCPALIAGNAVFGTLTLNITNAGNGGKGVTILYIK